MNVKVKKDSDDNSESFFVFYLFLKIRRVLAHFLHVPKEAHIAFGNRTSMNIIYMFLKRRTLPSAIVLR